MAGFSDSEERVSPMKKIPIIAVVGPTASGKTGLGIQIAKRFDGEVVSADSMQTYCGMDIATAKPCLLYTSRRILIKFKRLIRS